MSQTIDQWTFASLQKKPDLEEDVRSEVSTIGENITRSLSDYSIGDKEDPLIIFDWDDTLFPTTWLEKQELLLDHTVILEDEERAELSTLAERVICTLQTARACGTVVIVTNAMEGWVEVSCQRFMPSLWPYIAGLRVVSARSTYQDELPTEWKCAAFADEVRAHYRMQVAGERRNVVSLGDSLNEQRALVAVTQGVPNCFAKSLKFMDEPHISQLIEQHEFLTSQLQEVVDHEGSLDVEVADAH